MVDVHVFDGGYVFVAYVADVWVLVPDECAHGENVATGVPQALVPSAHGRGFLREGRAWGGGGALTAWVWVNAKPHALLRVLDAPLHPQLHRTMA